MHKRPTSRLLFVVNADWFFVSHRLRLAAACVKEGFDVAVCAGESAARVKIEAAGMRFFPLPIDRGGTDPVRDARTVRALLGTYREFSPDIVHHVTIKPVLYGSLAARMLNVPGIVNAVSGLGYAFIPRPDERLRNTALRQGLRLAYRGALAGSRTRVIFQNEDDQLAFTSTGLVPEARARLIRGSGVDLELFSSTPLPDSDFVALLPARLLWDKGIGEFVAAARLLKPQYPRARFVLLGRIDADNPAAITEAQVRDWTNTGAVEWWDARPHEEMPEMYRSAHVVVLPSYREGLPLALAEAAASGRVVITTDVAGCRDTVIQNETGWLVPARDSAQLTFVLAQAIVNRDRLEEMGKRGRRLAEERFASSQIIAQTRAVYAELLR